MPIPVNIKTYGGRYWQAENGGGHGLAAKGPWPQTWETFWIIPVDSPSSRYLSHGMRVWIRSESGHYVQAENGGGGLVNCRGPWGKEWETFTVVAPPDKIGIAITTGSVFGLKSHSGHFLCAEDGGGREIVANRTEMREWETFYAEIVEEPRLYVSLQTNDGAHYLQAQDGGGGALTAKGPWARQWETFEVLRGDPVSEVFGHGFHVHLRTENGHFIDVPQADSLAQSAADNCIDRQKTWFMMEFVGDAGKPLGTGRRVRLRTFNGKYVSADNGGGGAVRVRTGVPGDNETFNVDLRTGPSFIGPGPRQYGWVLLRDSIRINDELVAVMRREAAARSLAVGSNILLLARTVTHDPGYVLRVWEYNLTIVAESYDANGGGLTLTPPAISEVGAEGASGEKGSAGWLYGEPGGRGGPGTTGLGGTQSFGVCLLSREVKGVNVDCTGGKGGKGAKGGRGGNGGDVGYAPLVGGGLGSTAYGSSGGPGGPGGDGGRGGDGGTVMLYYASGTVSRILTQGGAGGSGGDGGDPGTKTGEEEFLGNQSDNYPYGHWAQLRTPQNGATGQTGKTGDSGKAAQAIRAKIDEIDFYERVRSTLGDYAKAWAAYRSRTGDYLERIYVPSDGSTLPHLEQAMIEADASCSLDPGSSVGKELRERLRLNQIPVGLERDHDVIPDFTRFEDFVTRYHGMVGDLFGSVTFLLANTSNLGAAADRLRNETGHTLSSIDILDSEIAAVDIDKMDLESQINRCVSKAQKLQEELNDRIHQMERIRATVEDGLNVEDLGLAVDVIEKIVNIVVMIYTGKGAWQTISSCIDLIGKVGSKFIDEVNEGNPKYEEDLESLAGRLGDMTKDGTELISRAKVLADLANVTLDTDDEELAKKIIELLKQAADLVFERATLELRLAQVLYRRNALVGRKQQAQDDADGLSRQTTEISGDLAVYANLIPSLLRVGRGYADLLMKHIFLAARAADIYTFRPVSPALSFDYGFAHPDVEENALDALRRGDSRGVTELVAGLLTSWNKLPQIIRYADMVQSYEEGLRSEIMYYYPLQDASALQRFKETGEAEFEVPLSQLLPGRLEAKIEALALALVGAETPDPAILCRLEHSGRGRIRAADGAEVEVIGLAREASVQASTLELAGVDTSESNLVAAYWGKSPTAVWRLWIEPAVMQRISLNNLTEIQMGIGYRARVI